MIVGQTWSEGDGGGPLGPGGGAPGSGGGVPPGRGAQDPGQEGIAIPKRQVYVRTTG